MTDFTDKWIAKREKLEGLLSAHDSLVDMCGDLTAAVAVGQLHVSDLLAEAKADARTSLPAAVAALKAVLGMHPATRLGCITHYSRSDCECEPRFTCATCAVAHPCPTVTAIHAALIGDGNPVQEADERG